GLREELLLPGKMKLGVLHQPIQDAAQRVPALSSLHRVVQLVHHADELLVVVVDDTDANTQLIRPGHQWHRPLLLPTLSQTSNAGAPQAARRCCNRSSSAASASLTAS